MGPGGRPWAEPSEAVMRPSCQRLTPVWALIQMLPSGASAMERVRLLMSPSRSVHVLTLPACRRLAPLSRLANQRLPSLAS